MSIQRFSHCSHWGAYTLLVEDGRIDRRRAVRRRPGALADHPFGAALGRPDAPHRAADGARGLAQAARTSGAASAARDKFVPVGWDEAATLVAGEIDRVRTEHGNALDLRRLVRLDELRAASTTRPRSCKRMMNLVGGYTGHVDTYSIAAGPVILRHTLGDAEACGGGANTLDTVAEHAETVDGVRRAARRAPRRARPAASARHTLEQNLRTMVARGVRDRARLAAARRHPRLGARPNGGRCGPNTDTALMLGLAGEIVAAGRHDRDFLARCCSGGDELLAYLTARATASQERRLGRGDLRARRRAHPRAGAPRGRDAHACSRSAGACSAPPRRAAVLGRARPRVGDRPDRAAGRRGRLRLRLARRRGRADAISRSPALPQGRNPNADFIPVARITDLLLNPGADLHLRRPDPHLPRHPARVLGRRQPVPSPPGPEPPAPRLGAAGDHHRAGPGLDRDRAARRHRAARDHLDRAQRHLRQQALRPPDRDAAGDRRRSAWRATTTTSSADIADELGVEPAFSEGRDEMGWIRRCTT